MKTKHWLTINSKGGARLTKNQPGLDWNEVSVMLEINLPDALFKKPKLVASITVPDEAAVSETIEGAVSDNVADAIKQATGLDFVISVAPAEAEE